MNIAEKQPKMNPQKPKTTSHISCGEEESTDQRMHPKALTTVRTLQYLLYIVGYYVCIGEPSSTAYSAAEQVALEVEDKLLILNSMPTYERVLRIVDQFPVYGQAHCAPGP